jgi:hypothetical protein
MTGYRYLPSTYHCGMVSVRYQYIFTSWFTKIGLTTLRMTLYCLLATVPAQMRRIQLTTFSLHRPMNPRLFTTSSCLHKHEKIISSGLTFKNNDRQCFLCQPDLPGNLKYGTLQNLCLHAHYIFYQKFCFLKSQPINELF